MQDTKRSKFLVRVFTILFLFISAAASGLLQVPENSEGGGRVDLTCFVTPLVAFEDDLSWEFGSAPVSGFNNILPGGDHLEGGGSLLTGESLLKRKLDVDVEEYDVEMIYADEGGELEVWDNEIEIPEDALIEDTMMLLYIPRSAYIEYWVYPPAMSFQDTVDIVFSYQFADMKWVDETNISVAQWVPDLQMWQNIGGEVDTLDNEISFKATSLTPPGANFSRYALADHN